MVGVDSAALPANSPDLGPLHPACLGAVRCMEEKWSQGKSFNQMLGLVNPMGLVLNLLGSQTLNTGLGVILYPLGMWGQRSPGGMRWKSLCGGLCCNLVCKQCFMYLVFDIN